MDTFVVHLEPTDEEATITFRTLRAGAGGEGDKSRGEGPVG